MYYLLIGIYDPSGFLFMKHSESRIQKLRWWHYCTAVAIISLGGVFIFSAKVQTLEIDKEAKTITKV